MTIAIDIDGTWSLDPELFFEFVWMAKNKGHNVIIVTGAQQPKEKLDRLSISHCPIDDFIVTHGELKESICLERGIKVDIWIDNEPRTIRPCKILQNADL